MKCPRRREGSVLTGYPSEDTWRDDNTCSYCGGLNPDIALPLLRDGAEITPTDKNYKAYVAPHRKLYFQHFSAYHWQELIDLLNLKKLVIAYPGHFYVKPFGVKVVTS